MPFTLRMLLLVGAFVALYIIARKVRHSKIQMEDSIYWLVLAAVLVVNAIFPGIAMWFSSVLGFISASNFVFLVVIALLLIKEFNNSADISLLKHKVDELAQEDALAHCQDGSEKAEKE
jgi:hypothetical protein